MNCFCDRLAIEVIARTLTGKVKTAISVISGLIDSIIANTPMIVSTAVISWVKLCCNVELILSTSFVTRLNISPCVLAS
ncbi:hypothetical protein D3C80_1909090 [compost metagenome]